MSKSNLNDICYIDSVIHGVLKNTPGRSVELLMREWRLSPVDRKDAFVAALIGKICVMNARAK